MDDYWDDWTDWDDWDMDNFSDMDNFPQPIHCCCAGCHFCCLVCVLLGGQVISRLLPGGRHGRRHRPYYRHTTPWWDDLSKISNFRGKTKLNHDVLDKDDSNGTMQMTQFTNLENSMRKNKNEIFQKPTFAGTSISSVNNVPKPKKTSSFVVNDGISNESTEFVDNDAKSNESTESVDSNGGPNETTESVDKVEVGVPELNDLNSEEDFNQYRPHVGRGKGKVIAVEKKGVPYVTTELVDWYGRSKSKTILVDSVPERIEIVKATMRDNNLLSEYWYHGGVSRWTTGGTSTGLYKPQLYPSGGNYGLASGVAVGNISVDF